MPNKETEYDVLGVLYKYAERRPAETYMNISDLCTETGLDHGPLTSVLLSLESKRWAELFRITGEIKGEYTPNTAAASYSRLPLSRKFLKAKITAGGRLVHEGRRFLGHENT